MVRRNVTSKNVGAWLGGNKGYLRSGQQSDQTTAKVDSGGGQMEQVRAELGLGAYAAGIGTTAAIGAGIAAVRSGRAAQAVNKLTGQEVLIHSSPIKNLSRIEPKISTDLSRLEPNKALTFGVRSSAKGSRNYVGQYAEEITSWRSTTATGLAGKPQSVYITKTPSKNVTPYQFQGMWGRTPSSQRVVKEIPIENKTVDQLAREIASASRRAGRPLRKEKNIVEDIRFKAAKASSRRKNKNNQIGPAID